MSLSIGPRRLAALPPATPPGATPAPPACGPLAAGAAGGGLTVERVCRPAPGPAPGLAPGPAPGPVRNAPLAPPPPGQTGIAARAGAVLRGLLDLVMDGFLGVGHSLRKAAVSVGRGELGSAMISVVAIPFNALALLGMRAVHLYRITFRDPAPPRPLTGEEQAILRRVFGPSLRLGSIRIAEDDGLLTAQAEAITLGNVIRIRQGKPLTLGTLVHEATHCWQHQNGGSDHLLRALGAQLFRRDGYDFEQAIREGRSWEQLSPEQQANLLMVAAESGYFDLGGQSFLIDPYRYKSASLTEQSAPRGARDRTGYLRAAIGELRAGRGTESPGD